MEYVKWRWYHDYADEPIWFYAELDGGRWAVRSLEVFRDGRLAYAGEGEEQGTFLPEAPYPPDEEINSMGDYHIQRITPEEFERVWARRKTRWEAT